MNTTEINNEKTSISSLKKEKGIKKLPRQIVLKISKALKKNDIIKARSVIDNWWVENTSTGKFPVVSDFGPPVFVPIISYSRPPEEWPLFKASVAIQNYIFNQSQSDFDLCDPGTSTESHKKWFAIHNEMNQYSNSGVQGLNYIFKYAVNVRNGEFVKVNNRNKKKENIQKNFIPESAIDSNGFLNKKPNANNCIFGCQGISPEIFNPTLKIHGHIPIPENFQIIHGEIPKFKTTISRLQITKGNPGWIPRWQLSLVTHGKNKRQRVGKHGTPLFLVIRVKDDWVTLDARALLRNVYWRHPDVRGKLTMDTLLQYFTGDVRIEPFKKRCVFAYNQERVGIENLQLISTKKSKSFLENIVNQSGQVCLVSADLGQTNLIALDYSRVSNSENLNAETICREFLPENIIEKFTAIRIAADQNEEIIRQSALEMLPEESKIEIKQYYSEISKIAKLRIIELLGTDSLPWEMMKPGSKFISEWIEQNMPKESISKIENEINNSSLRNKKKLFKYTYSDLSWAVEIKNTLPKISPQIRKEFDEHIWKIKTNSKEYEKLAKRKQQTCRYVANWIVDRAKKVSQLDNVCLVVEDLNVNGKFFDGKGKYITGFEGFFGQKSENRWFIKALKKSICELATNKGIPVITVMPHRTSQTCPKCRHVDPKNRVSEKFQCTKCNITLNADLDVATHNLRQIALTSEPMPEGERSSAKKSSRIARGRKVSNLQAN